MKRLLALLLCLILCLSMIPAGYAGDIEIVDPEEEIAIIEPMEEIEEEDLISIVDPGLEETDPDEIQADSTVNYRALLVGEVNFSFETANRNRGDINLIGDMLGNVYGPEGNRYTVTKKTDLSINGIRNAISSTFSGADSNDVSLFFMATHGVTNIESGPYAGELLTIEEPGVSDGYLLLEDLASWLSDVPGKVIVVLGSCGSGAAILANGTMDQDPAAIDQANAHFTEAVIRCFEAADRQICDPGVSETQTGEFRSSKFYVLTAAAHMESSWGQESSTPYNYFPYYFAFGASNGMPADDNGNGVVTLNEMYEYVYLNAYGPYNDGTGDYYQHAQVYPTGSSYKLFSATGDSRPVITTQPKSVTAAIGATAKFTVKATDATSYQWQYRRDSSDSWHTSTLTGAKTATMSVEVTEARDGFQYRCKVTNSSGSVYSDAATLTVNYKPAIATQPSSVNANVGASVKFTVKAYGTGLSYQWQFRKSSSGTWSNSSATGAKTATLTVEATEARSGYQYRCKVTNSYGSATSSAATLTVGSKPSITTQPKSTSVTEGTTVKFTVKASGSGLSYQWQFRKSSSGTWANSTATGNKTATLTVEATAARSGYQYRCKVTNTVGTATSSAATLTVLTKPSITTQPKSQTVDINATVKFTVKASGGGLSYQWQFRKSSSGTWANSTATGAKTATLTVEATTARNGYQYRCKVTNTVGTATSSAATLTVKDLTTYRALLVGQTYSAVSGVSTLYGDMSVDMMKNMLSGVVGAKGGSIKVTSKIDLSKSGFQSAINTAFSGADSNDVSIFYYNGHGVESSYEPYMGALVTAESDGSSDILTTAELADMLSAVPGKVVVFLDSCFAGAAIYNNGSVTFVQTDSTAQAFSSQVVNVFAEKDEQIALAESADQPNMGELCTSKFYVLTACAYDEYSYAYVGYGGVFTSFLVDGINGSMPADTSGDSKVSVHELYSWLTSEIDSQTTQEYPKNSTYTIFASK